MDAEDLSLTGLWRYANYLDQQGLDGAPYLLAFWTKVLQPLMMCAMVFIAIGSLLAPLLAARWIPSRPHFIAALLVSPIVHVTLAWIGISVR